MAIVIEEVKTLIQLHQAMLETFNVVHLRRICRWMGVDPEMLSDSQTEGELRELILLAVRCGLVPELLEACQQVQPGFEWKNRDLTPLFAISDAARQIDVEALITAIANHFSPTDLKTLCFYLGIDYDDLDDRHLDRLPGGRRRYLASLDVEVEGLSDSAVETLLKELWADEFATHCRRWGLWERAVSICLHLRPEAFGEWGGPGRQTGIARSSGNYLERAMSIDRKELHRFLRTRFNREELDTLCFDLGFDPRRLSAQILSGRARELIDLATRQGRIPQLLDLLQRERPRLFGGQEPPPPVLPSAAEVGELDRVGLRWLLADHLTYAHIRALGAELGVDADQLPANARSGKAREMVLLLEEQDRLGELRERLARHVSGAQLIVPQEPDGVIAPEPPAVSSGPPPNAASPLADWIAFYLDEQGLRTLCFHLGVEYEDLERAAHLARARSLVGLCAGRGHLDWLLACLRRDSPEVDWPLPPP